MTHGDESFSELVLLPGDQPAREAAPFDDVDRLIAELRAYGIDDLTGGRDPALAAFVERYPLPRAILLRQLAACPEPSVRDASIALLLLRPELVSQLPLEIATDSSATDESIAESPSTPPALVTLALAAAYLQRIWRTRLSLAGASTSPLIIGYWRSLNLPDPDDSAEEGVRALAIYERGRRGQPLNYLAMWQQPVDHLIHQ